MEADERIRLFCGLQLPADAVEEIGAWQAEHLAGVRIVPPENLHITLVFLGWRPVSDVPAVAAELAAASGAAAPARFAVRRYRETKQVGMLVLDELDGTAARALAGDLRERLERLELAPVEARRWLPHITVARFREPPGIEAPAPNMCSINVVRSALYRSSLGPGGAQYDAVETVALGGR